MNKPTFKFNLTINEQQADGFKLAVQTSTEKELKVAQELTTLLIEKIKSIEVKIVNYNE